jgi:hypothetical protein
MKSPVAACVALGCGGGGAGGWHRRDHLHQTNESPISVAAGGCVVAAGPVDVNAAGTMFYEIDDAAPGTDAIEAVIISDSFYGSEG